ncbi:MAG TPA: C39 family peptidase [Candidatus Eisenbacteria bacterium]|nr:C39 family peptidase [Candidatus Eisenbacteria bacterium]
MKSLRLVHLVTAVIVTATLSGTLATGPSPASPPALALSSSPELPATGLVTTTRLKVWHEGQPGGEIVDTTAEPAVDLRVYALYQPPAPPTAVDIVPWMAPAGYRTVGVPVYQQAMTLDCETSALRMGLAAYGHYYSDAALFANESVDSRAPVMGPNHTVLQWGDPYTNFVGNVWGNDWTPTGYGIYYPPIVAIAQSHGLPNTYGGEGFAPSTIYNELLAGHPVEVWIETNWSKPWLGTWTAWDGRRIRYSYAEHAVTLSGVSASQVRVNDPLHGTQYWVSKWLFESVWADFDNMAVVFR